MQKGCCYLCQIFLTVMSLNDGNLLKSGLVKIEYDIGGETAKPAGIIPLRPASVAAGFRHLSKK